MFYCFEMAELGTAFSQSSPTHKRHNEYLGSLSCSILIKARKPPFEFRDAVSGVAIDANPDLTIHTFD